jgi:hypothetical protein
MTPSWSLSMPSEHCGRTLLEDDELDEELEEELLDDEELVVLDEELLELEGGSWRFLKAATAQLAPGATFKRPCGGVMLTSCQPDATSSSTVCHPGVTLS